MIKIKRSIILAVAFVMVLGSLTLGDNGDLPTIELKEVRLRGTVISGLFKPIAIIEDINAKKNYWYEVGDLLCGGRITQIQRGAIVLEMNGGLYLFGLPKGQIEGLGPILAKEIVLGEKVGENAWKVELNAAVDVLTRAGRIMKEARIRPYFALGKAAGIRIDRIKKSSIIKGMGLQDGDIIKGVNGFGLMSPTRIFEAYRKYKDEQLIQVQLIREDRPITLTYDIVR